MKHALFVCCTALTLTFGCSWVELDPGADSVRLVESSRASNCERLAMTTTSVRSRVAGVERSPDKVAAELADLARNSARELDGDTIVADGPLRDGEQRFIIYRCRGR